MALWVKNGTVIQKGWETLPYCVQLAITNKGFNNDVNIYTWVCYNNMVEQEEEEDFFMCSSTNANMYVHIKYNDREEAFHLSYLNSSNPCNFDGKRTEVKVASSHNKMHFFSV